MENICTDETTVMKEVQQKLARVFIRHNEKMVLQLSFEEKKGRLIFCRIASREVRDDVELLKSFMPDILRWRWEVILRYEW